MSQSPFSPRTVKLIAVLGGISLLAGFAGAVFGDPVSDEGSHGADSFSSSAIGHRAFVELLQRSGREVVRSRGLTERKTASGSLLVLLEPPGDESDRIREMLEGAERALVVLPKWDGYGDHRNPGWLRRVELISVSRVEDVLEACDVEGDLVREPGPEGPWRTGSFRARPALGAPQLVRSTELQPHIACEHGVLLGRAGGDRGRVWVLTDPDILANHAIANGQNAALVLEIIDDLARDRPIIVDETLHGFTSPPHVWGELGRFPLVLLLVHAVFTIALLVWAGTRRFGAPVSEGEGLGFGKSRLIENTSELVLYGGHSASVLRRYLELEERRVAAARHLPPGLEPEARRARLAAKRTGEAGTDLTEVADVVANACAAETNVEQRVLRAARRVHRWREEMLDGAR